MNTTLFTFFLRTSRPLFLLGGFLMYVLGIGVAYYYGAAIQWSLAIIGLLWLFSLQLGGSFLHGYFNSRTDLVPGDEGNPARFSRPIQLFVAYAFLAILAAFSVFIIRDIKNPTVYFIMVLMVCGALSYSVPPFRLENSGYGELVLSLLIANFTPALGYLIQGGDSLQFLAMVTFPLTVLHLAMLLVFSLSMYAGDMKLRRRTLMQRMGWQNGMLLHNIFILCAYILLLLAVRFGLPWRIGIPALFTLPLGLFEIWTIQRIAAGAKPPWRLLKVNAVSVFGITAYLLAFGFWIH